MCSKNSLNSLILDNHKRGSKGLGLLHLQRENYFEYKFPRALPWADGSLALQAVLLATFVLPLPSERAGERPLFSVFSAMAAEFWNKTVMYLWAVQKLAFRHRPEGQHVRS